MKTKNIIAWAVFTTLGLTACSNEEEIPTGGPTDPLAVKIEASISNKVSRSNPVDDTKSTAFNEGDLLNVSAGNQTVVFEKTATEWKPADPANILQWMETEMTFKAHHPANALVDGVFTLPTDQSDAVKIAAADYMSYQGVHSHADGAVNLVMERQTARVKITGFNMSSDWKAKNPEIQSVTFYSLDRIGGMATPQYVEVMPVVADGCYTALLIPTTGNTEQNFLKINVTIPGESNVEFYVKGIPALESGKSHSFKVNLSSEIAQIGDFSVLPWEEGTQLHPTIDPILPTVDPIKHSIIVYDPGSLKKEMLETAVGNSQQLTIEGPLNGDDISLIREAAGRNYSEAEVPHILTQLNMSKAQIVKGGGSYISGYNEYDQSIDIHTSTDVIGYHMFKDTKLTALTIPETATKIDDEAFANCNFEEFILPSSVDTIYTFGLRSLRTKVLTLPASIKNFVNTGDIYVSNRLNFFIQKPTSFSVNYMSFPGSENVDIYLHESWKDDITNSNQWAGKTWKSITLIDAQGTPVTTNP